MEIDIRLENHAGYQWKTYKNISFRGYLLHCNEDKILEELSLLNRKEKILERIGGLFGGFAFVVRLENEVLAICDRTRSIPLYYCERENRIEIFDLIDCKDNNSYSIDEDVLRMFQKTLFTVENATLLEGVFQIPAGSCLGISLKDEKCEITEYWAYSYAESQIDDIRVAINLLSQTYDAVFADVAEYVGGRQVVIPLSGGHDSRLVAYYLRKFGIKNIIAFSYGEERNDESTIAESVAKALGINYYFIYYGKEQIDFFRENLDEYLVYSAGFCSVPVIQNFAAIRSLESQRLIEKDAIFIPGLGGVLSGHNVYEPFYVAKQVLSEELAEFTYQSYFCGSDAGVKPRILEHIYSSLDIQKGGVLSGNQAIERFETYTFKEEQAKYIANGGRTYEYFNHQWMTPLFDARVYDTWSKISNSLRIKDIAIKEMEKSVYPADIQGIPYVGSKESKHFLIQDQPTKLEVLKTRLRRYIHPRSTHYMKKFFTLKDCYYVLLFCHESDITSLVRFAYIRALKRQIKK